MKRRPTDRRPNVRRLSKHLEVIRGLGVLVAGDDLRRHPVRRPDERVPPSHRAVQLSAHTKVHCQKYTQSTRKTQKERIGLVVKYL